MPRRIHFYDPPERFVAGTVGEPGQRTFFLQARDSHRITTVALEKVQVQLLAEKIDELLDELASVSESEDAASATAAADTDPLEQPLVEEFRVGNVRLGYHEQSGSVVIEAFNAEDPEPDPNEGDVPAEPRTLEEIEADDNRREALIVRLSPGQARGFAARAAKLVAAGRPPCPFCSQPLDPEGHLCPRQNGYKRRG